MKIIAIELEDGSTSIMQLYADVIIEAEVRRAALPSPAVSWREITDAEAAQIRARRPKPEPAVVVSSPEDTAEIASHLAELYKRNQTLEAQVAALLSRVDDIDATPIRQVEP